jgi:glycosyltransferase involved in cell wall biosynthesis
MPDPSVSVLIPAYKSEGTIGRAVDSVLAQTIPVQEIIVVDDGSPHDIAPALARFGDKVKLIRKTNGGAADARNVGVDHATGDWVAFLDADDYWHPRKIEKQLAVLRDHPKLDVIGSQWHTVEAGDVLPLSADEPLPVAPPGPTDVFLGRVLELKGSDAFAAAMHFWTSTLLVRRAIMTVCRFEPGFEPAEDRHLWIRLASRYPVYLLPDALAVYVQSPGSLSNSNVDRDCGNMLRVIREFPELLGKAGIRAEEAKLYRRWTASHLHAGNPLAAVTPATRRVRLRSWSIHAWLVLLKTFWLALWYR